jgi:hypothetical protein
MVRFIPLSPSFRYRYVDIQYLFVSCSLSIPLARALRASYLRTINRHPSQGREPGSVPALPGRTQVSAGGTRRSSPGRAVPGGEQIKKRQQNSPSATELPERFAIPSYPNHVLFNRSRDYCSLPLDKPKKKRNMDDRMRRPMGGQNHIGGFNQRL